MHGICTNDAPQGHESASRELCITLLTPLRGTLARLGHNGTSYPDDMLVTLSPDLTSLILHWHLTIKRSCSTLPRICVSTQQSCKSFDRAGGIPLLPPESRYTEGVCWKHCSPVPRAHAGCLLGATKLMVAGLVFYATKAQAVLKPAQLQSQSCKHKQELSMGSEVTALPAGTNTAHINSTGHTPQTKQ